MTRRALLFAAFSLSLLSLPTLPAHAQGDGAPLVDTLAQGKGRINYAAGTVRATGYGAPPTGSQNPAQAKLMAVGAARADALRNLAMAVSSIQVTATTKVKNYVTESDTVETKVSALLQNARIVAEAMGKDGTASVTVEIPLYGRHSVASAVLPEVALTPALPTAPASRGPLAVASAPEPAPLPKAAVGSRTVPSFKEPHGGAKLLRARPYSPPSIRRNATLPLTPGSQEGPFSSVIIDCRGLGIQAVMSPKVYDTTGREIYGTMQIDMDFAIEIGIVGYPRTIDEALAGKRAGEKPLVVRAVRPKDSFKIDVVVSDSDGRRILEANQRDGFLEKCRVILLCDPVR